MDKADAFEALFRAHYTSVLRYAQRRLDDPDSAQDICAETFAIAWKRFDSDKPHPLPWLYRTAHNLIGNQYRSITRERNAVSLVQEQLRAESQTHDSDRLADAMARLKENEREALRLTFWENLSAAEVAIVLNCTEQAAWKRISRAKTALRTELAAANTLEVAGGDR